MIKHTDVSKCIHCKKCTKHCTFLTKYNLTIGDIEDIDRLKYHCFLCGECTRVCPKDIDGREIILNLRKNEVERPRYGLKERGYLPLLIEKKDYIFKNYRKKPKKIALFPGCNFPSFFPKTMTRLSKLLEKEASIETIYDCCGKPISELGLSKEESSIIKKLDEYFLKNKIEEVVVVCPNCFYHLRGRLSVKITNIYKKLLELKLGNRIKKDVEIFLPCPDRDKKEWMADIKNFIDGAITFTEGIQCCGLGGCAIVKERELARDLAKKIKKTCKGEHFSYCATCSGNLTRGSMETVSHFLPYILGVDEEPDTKHSFMNRARTKIR